LVRAHPSVSDLHWPRKLRSIVPRSAYGAGPRAVGALVAAWPAGLQRRTRDGCLPLHMAAAGAPPASVAILLQGWPAALRELDRTHGGLPLHVAAATNRPVNTD